MRSNAITVEAYLDELPAERAAAISAVRDLMLANLPEGYVETMNWGMISYEIPLARFKDTYNKKPLMYAALGNQKNHMAIYLCGLYCKPEIKASFEAAYKAAGRKLDMGAACLRFKKLEDLCTDAIAKTIASVSVEEFIETTIEAHRKK